MDRTLQLPVEHTEDFIRGYQPSHLINTVKDELPFVADQTGQVYTYGGWQSWADITGDRRSLVDTPTVGFRALSAPYPPDDNSSVLLEVDLGGVVVEHAADEETIATIKKLHIDDPVVYRAEWQRILRAYLFLHACCWKTNHTATHIAFSTDHHESALGPQAKALMWVCPTHQALLAKDKHIQICPISSLTNTWGYEAKYGGSLSTTPPSYWVLRRLGMRQTKHIEDYPSIARETVKPVLIVIAVFQSSITVLWALLAFLPRNRPPTIELWLDQPHLPYGIDFYIVILGICVIEAAAIHRDPDARSYSTILKTAFSASISAIIIDTLMRMLGADMLAARRPLFYPPDLLGSIALLFIVLGTTAIALHNRAIYSSMRFWLIFMASSAAISGIALYR